MSARLNTSNDDLSVPHVLDPSFDKATSTALWTQTARCYLRLLRLSFLQIGALIEAEAGTYIMSGRLITYDMTSMVRLSNFHV